MTKVFTDTLPRAAAGGGMQDEDIVIADLAAKLEQAFFCARAQFPFGLQPSNIQHLSVRKLRVFLDEGEAGLGLVAHQAFDRIRGCLFLLGDDLHF